MKLEVRSELKGRNRRIAAGAALYQIMSDLMFKTIEHLDRPCWSG